MIVSCSRFQRLPGRARWTSLHRPIGPRRSWAGRPPARAAKRLDADADAEALIDKLRGTDRRSTGRSDEVVRDVLAEPTLFGALVDAVTASDAVVRMRAADAAEKSRAGRPDLLTSHKARLLAEVAAVRQQEVRWHVAQILPRLALTGAERDRAVERCSATSTTTAASSEPSPCSARYLAATDNTLRDRVTADPRAPRREGHARDARSRAQAGGPAQTAARALQVQRAATGWRISVVSFSGADRVGSLR
jgi:hypothetical protein